MAGTQAFADDPRGRNLAEEAIWLGRVVVALAPDEPEALGLLALMLYADSRRAARRDAAGRYVPLARAGRRAAGTPTAIDEAERLLRAASALAAARPLPARGGDPVGPRRAPHRRRDRLAGDRRAL